MSRSGYVDDWDDRLQYYRWRQAVRRALQGRRGQALLRELLIALDEMEDKRLYPGSFSTAEGEFCALGVLGARRGLQMDDLGDGEDGCDPKLVGQRFGIAMSMAAEIMYLNDEYFDTEWVWKDVEICGPMRRYCQHKRRVRVHNPHAPHERWQQVRAWVVENLRTGAPKGDSQ